MHYDDSQQQAAEYVRIALPLMARHGVTPHPVNYTVWYEYVSGRNRELKQTLDQYLAEHGAVPAEFNEDLYRKFFASREQQIADQMQVEVARMLGMVMEQIGRSSSRTSEYGDLLARYSERLSRQMGLEELRGLLNELLEETRDMREVNRELELRLTATTRELEDLRRELETARHEATTDALTEIANRKAFDDALAAAMERARESGEPLCLLLADVDHFKHFNDAHGHLLGDRLLRFVARAFKESVKGQDLVARFGGEEFAVLLPATPLNGARTVAEHIRSTLAGQRLRRTDTDQSVGAVTLSFGVARYRPDESVEAFVSRADSALYLSKQQGRNRVSSEEQLQYA